MNDLKPLVNADGWHCEPSCPLRQAGRCTYLGVDLDWYDYYISACTQGASIKQEGGSDGSRYDT